MKLYSDEMVDLTQEYFVRKKPVSQKLFIWIISALLIALIIFIAFAPFEEVVKVSGYIRPVENISSVSNAVTGRILTVSYKPGKEVYKNQLLLEIDPTQLESQKQSLISQMQEENKKLEAAYQIQESIESDNNVIDKNNYPEAYLRYSLWKINLQKLEYAEKLNYERLCNEKALPETMTTISHIHELEAEYLISQKEYENFDVNFRHDIISQIDELETSEEINDAKLKQIEDSLLYTKVTAPIDGIIQEITPFNENDWVQSGQKLFNIVPFSQEESKVELDLQAKQAGKLETGMKVKMHFPSLPYHEFGGAEGTIITIDPDITRNQNGDAYFVILTDLDKKSLTSKKGKEYPLKVGLQVDARIIVSKKTILKYVLEKMNLCY
jgi:membrane fusion protein, peptide pheromone/bacteriocin exporter